MLPLSLPGKWNAATNFKSVRSLFQPPAKRPVTRAQAMGKGLTGKPLAALMQQWPTPRQSWNSGGEEKGEEDAEEVIEVSSVSSGEGKIESAQLCVIYLQSR